MMTFTRACVASTSRATPERARLSRKAKARSVSGQRERIVARASRTTLRDALRSNESKGSIVFVVDEGENTRAVFVGGGRDALEAYAESTERDVETLWVRWETLGRRARASALNAKVKETIAALGYAPEDNAGAVASATQKAAEPTGGGPATLARSHLEALDRDGIVVIDGMLDAETLNDAVESVRALHARGLMRNLEQSGRDDDVAVLSTSALPSGREFLGLRPVVRLLLDVPNGLRRALDDNTSAEISEDTRSKIRSCAPPDRLMAARYGHENCRYVAHLDNDPRDPGNDVGTPGLRPADRVFTCIAYLNPNWIPAHEGRFRYFPIGADVSSSNFTDIDPLCGRVVVFDSSKLLHEVRPSAADRFAVTAWTYDRSRVSRSVPSSRAIHPLPGLS